MNSTLRPLRVLLIVDSLYWVIGNFAKQITKDNPEIEASICSKFTINKTIARFGQFPTSFDVVHYLTSKPLKLFLGQTPTVTTLHHRNTETKIMPFHESDAVMSVSRQWYNHLIQQGVPERKLALIPFGVDTEQFRPHKNEERNQIRNELGLPHDAFVVGFAGKSSSDKEGRKGLHCFANAIKQLNTQLSNLHVLVIGPGWKRLFHQFSLDRVPCTHLPYHIDHGVMAKFYWALDVHWITSMVEGGPVPLFEAMASGIPCISTPVGGALDVLHNRHNGFIVPFNASEQFALLSLRLSKEHYLKNQIGEEARKTIVRERQWRDVRKNTLALYQLAIENFQNRKIERGGKVPHGNLTKRRSTNRLNLENLPAHIHSLKMHNWMKACEQINGIKMMIKIGEWKTASRLGIEALGTSLFTPYLWKDILSAFFTKGKLRVDQKMAQGTKPCTPIEEKLRPKAS